MKSSRFFELCGFLFKILPNGGGKLAFLLCMAALELTVVVLLPLVGARIVDVLHSQDWHAFKYYLFLLLILTLGQVVIGFPNRFLHLVVNESLGNNIRQLVLNSVLHKRLHFFEKIWVGDIVSRILNDTTKLKNFLTHILLQIIVDILTLSIVIVVLVLMNPVLALLTITVAPLTLLVGRVMHSRLELMNLRVREIIASLNGHLQSWLTRSFFVRIYGLEGHVSKNFATSSNQLKSQSVRLATSTTIAGAINAMLLTLPSTIVFAYGGYLTFQNLLTVGQLFAFITFASYFNAPIQRLMQIRLQEIPTYYAVKARIDEIIKLEGAEVATQHHLVPMEIEKINIENLIFEFSNGNNFTLEVPEFSCSYGEIVGVTGPNGCGKSTLCRLLIGLHKPQSGSISIVSKTGQVIQAKGLSLGQWCGLLPQQSEIFDGSIVENITLFDRNPNTEKLYELTVLLDMAEWIKSLPKGWETKVNSGLLRSLSGGQIQKLSIARVFYLERPVLILDELENGLDGDTRKKLFDYLRQQAKTMLCILIAHNAETLSICDRIYTISSIASKTNTYHVQEINELHFSNALGRSS